MKVLAILFLALILACVVLAIIIKIQSGEKKKLKCEIEDAKSSYFELNQRFEKLLEENEIEKKHNQELAKKLADISCMSIDDVLQQLQNG